MNDAATLASPAPAAAEGEDRSPTPRATAIDRHVGARMRERRVFLGQTLQEVADLLGVTYQQAHKYERGTNRIAVGRLHGLAQVLGVEVGYFFQGQEGERAGRPTEQQHRMLELARLFAAIPERRHQELLCHVARTLAEADARAAADTQGRAAA